MRACIITAELILFVTGYHELYAMLESECCKITQTPISTVENSRVQMTGCSAVTEKHMAVPFLGDSGSAQLKGTAGAARMVAYCGEGEDGTGGVRRGIWHREAVQPSEGS